MFTRKVLLTLLVSNEALWSYLMGLWSLNIKADILNFCSFVNILCATFTTKETLNYRVLLAQSFVYLIKQPQLTKLQVKMLKTRLPATSLLLKVRSTTPSHCFFAWIKYFGVRVQLSCWPSNTCPSTPMGMQRRPVTSSPCPFFFFPNFPASFSPRISTSLTKHSSVSHALHSIISHPLAESPMTYSCWWIFPVCSLIRPFFSQSQLLAGSEPAVLQCSTTYLSHGTA